MTTPPLALAPLPPPTRAQVNRALASNSHCSVARSLDVLGDAWSFLVLREPFFRVRRFDDIQRNLGVSRNVLTQRLAALVAAGLLSRHAYSERPLRHEYRLTAAGLDLYPALLALLQWGDTYQRPAGEAGVPLQLVHLGCGQGLHTALVCSHCRAVVEPRQVQPEPGHGFALGDAPVVRATRRNADAALYTRGRRCSVARALAIVGDRWTFQVLRAAFFGIRRFDELIGLLGIARNVLSKRLQHLVDHGVLTRSEYQQHPPRHDYRLTAKGLALYPAFVLMMRWSDQWNPGEAGPPLRLRHLACGHLFTPTLVCAHCQQAVQAREVSYHNGG